MRLSVQIELLPVEAHLIGGRCAVAEPRRPARNTDAAGADPALDRTARAEAGLREQLLQSDHAIIATKSYNPAAASCRGADPGRRRTIMIYDSILGTIGKTTVVRIQP